MALARPSDRFGAPSGWAKGGSPIGCVFQKKVVKIQLFWIRYDIWILNIVDYSLIVDEIY